MKVILNTDIEKIGEVGDIVEVKPGFARNYLLNGGDIFSLQKILGHSSLASVRVYLNLFAADVKQQHLRFSPVDNLAPTLTGCRF